MDIETAYPRSLAELHDLLQEVEVDSEGLRLPLRRCALEACHGTCCHDGVYLSHEEAEVLRQLTTEAREDWEDMGLDLPEKLVVYGEWRDVASGPKTAVRPHPKRALVADYPAHFPETQCALMLPDARCSLQVLAVRQGKHPWFYKPATCWMHPLSVRRNEHGKQMLTVHSHDNDPQVYPDYDGFVSRTPCGAACAQGEPAHVVLKEELDYLGRIARRDFSREILSASDARGDLNVSSPFGPASMRPATGARSDRLP